MTYSITDSSGVVQSTNGSIGSLKARSTHPIEAHERRISWLEEGNTARH